MLCVNSTYTDACFNLAAEEYLLKNFSAGFFMLYQNESSVIVGKHQHVLAEINLDFVTKNEIKIVRRYSGGGAVFHDLGNLNLTFIENGRSMNFDRFNERVIAMLSNIGIRTETNERRAINIDGLKISGSAQCITKNRIMYHATLLFSSDLDSLTSALDSDPEQPENVADNIVYVRSVKSEVTNLREHLETPLETAHFKDYVMDYFLKENQGNRIYEFTQKDVSEINVLVSEKYGTREWNFYGNKFKTLTT